MHTLQALDALTTEQVQFFKDNGYLVLQDLLDPAHVATLRRNVGEFLGMDPDAPESWRKQDVRSAPRPFAVDPPEMGLRHVPGLRNAVAELGGGTFRGGSEQLILNWPLAPGTPWKQPEKGHIDLIFVGLHWRFSLGATTYLYEVEHGGGAFCVWPGSHYEVWRYFQENPADYLTGMSDDERHAMEARLNARITSEPVEFLARPGTVILWHPFVLHEVSRNVRQRPRVGIFCRWGEPVEADQPVETFGDPWEHWAI